MQMKPWETEPNRVEWTTKAGYHGLMVRGYHGAWCGYVGLAPDHPLYGKNYQEVDVSVHGGLTYGEYCQDDVCYKPKEGEPEHLYWLGFDCVHGYDYAPNLPWYSADWKTYKDVVYVSNEVEELADQLKEMSIEAK